jgi:hypothetical protein
MRESGPTRLIVYCGDYHYAHSVVIEASCWDDDVRLSDLEPKFTCRTCGHRCADVRPLFDHERRRLRKMAPARSAEADTTEI